jgi:hypothetical protein
MDWSAGYECDTCGERALPRYPGGFPFCHDCERFVDLPAGPIVTGHAGAEPSPTWEEAVARELGCCCHCRRWLPLAELVTHIVRSRPAGKPGKAEREATLAIFGPAPAAPPPGRFNRWYECAGGCR